MDSFADEIGVPREYFSDLPRQFNLDHIIYTLLSVNHPTVAKYVNIPEPSLKALILSAREIVVKEKSLLNLSAPIKICGDIHGQYYDLLRLFDMGGFPPESKYLFLGDYVDRGNFSIECIVLLLCYKVKYPDNIFLLRGNHECAPINRLYGFFDECFTRYSEHLWKLFIDLFKCLPISAVVEDKIFCTHGGLSPHLLSLKHIRDIERPTDIPESGLLCDLLWADPSTEINRWGRNERGISCTFGEGSVTAFLDKFDFDLVVRAHQVVPDGYEVIMGQKLVTVFSAPNYCGEFDNAGAILCVDAQLMCSFSVIRPREKPMVIDYSSCTRRYPAGYSQRLMMHMRESGLDDADGLDGVDCYDGTADGLDEMGIGEMQSDPLMPDAEDGSLMPAPSTPHSLVPPPPSAALKYDTQGYDESTSSSSDYPDDNMLHIAPGSPPPHPPTPPLMSTSTRSRQSLRRQTAPLSSKQQKTTTSSSSSSSSSTRPRRPSSPLSASSTSPTAPQTNTLTPPPPSTPPAGSVYAALMPTPATKTQGRPSSPSTVSSTTRTGKGTLTQQRTGTTGARSGGGTDRRSTSPSASYVRSRSEEREAANTRPPSLSQRLNQIAAMKQGERK